MSTPPPEATVTPSSPESAPGDHPDPRPGTESTVATGTAMALGCVGATVLLILIALVIWGVMYVI